VVEMRTAFDRRRRRMHELLSAMPGVRCLEPEGAFYAFPSFEGVVGRVLRGQEVTSTLQLADLVLDEVKVAFVPGEAFGTPGYARFSFAMADDAMVEGLTRIADLLNGG
jgi:aspartate aminotransferase